MSLRAESEAILLFMHKNNHRDPGVRLIKHVEIASSLTLLAMTAKGDRVNRLLLSFPRMQHRTLLDGKIERGKIF